MGCNLKFENHRPRGFAYDVGLGCFSLGLLVSLFPSRGASLSPHKVWRLSLNPGYLGSLQEMIFS